ncbi:MAG: hypothetical protein FWD49_06605 [Firmicutes bacterium]|nr:hypothetical protein [Bacillota bacterium]
MRRNASSNTKPTTLPTAEWWVLFVWVCLLYCRLAVGFTHGYAYFTPTGFYKESILGFVFK